MAKKEEDILKSEKVYFLLHSDSYKKSYVKIGKSDSESGVVARLKGCQTGNPIKLILLGYIEGEERVWQSFFSDERIRGEWFDYSYASKFINQLKLKVPKVVLDDFKREKIENLNRKILNIKKEIRGGDYYDRDPNEGENDEDYREYHEAEFTEIGELKEEIARIDNLKGHNLLETYNAWALKNTEEGYRAYRESEDIRKEQRKEALDNMHNIEKVIYFLHKGLNKDHWYGGNEIRLAESKSSFFDFFGNIVNPGEYYVMVDEYQSGYSLSSGLMVLRLFLKFLETRKSSKFIKKGIYRNKTNKIDDKKIDKYREYLDEQKIKYSSKSIIDITKKIELTALKGIIDQIKSNIDEELGILYYDNNLATWRHKEKEKWIDQFLKNKSIIDKVNKNNLLTKQ